MTRDQLENCRHASRLAGDALDRVEMLESALDDARSRLHCRNDELAEELARSGVPEGEGFEHNGLVSWYRERRRGRLSMEHVRLALFREAR